MEVDGRTPDTSPAGNCRAAPVRQSLASGGARRAGAGLGGTDQRPAPGPRSARGWRGAGTGCDWQGPLPGAVIAASFQQQNGWWGLHQAWVLPSSANTMTLKPNRSMVLKGCYKFGRTLSAEHR